MKHPAMIDLSKAQQYLQKALASLEVRNRNSPQPVLAEYRLRRDIAKLRDDLQRLDGSILVRDLAGRET